MEKFNIILVNNGKVPVVFNTTKLKPTDLVETSSVVTQSAIVSNLQALIATSSTPLLTDYGDSVATTQFVTDKIADVVGSAPDVLNSIQELATALGNDQNFAVNVNNRITNNTNNIITNANNITLLKSDLSGNVYNYALNSSLNQLKSDLSGNVYNYALNSALNQLKTDLSGNVYKYALNSDLITTNTNIASLKSDLSGNTYNYALNSSLNQLKSDLSGNVYNYALNSDLSTTNANLTTANNNIANLSNLKADKLNPSLSGVATFNAITTQSLTDNGNIAIKGNTTIGDASGDTLIVTGLSTFNQDVIIKGTNVPTKFSTLDGSISTINSNLTTTNTNISNIRSDLSGNVYNYALSSTLNQLKSDLSGNVYNYALNGTLNQLKSDLSGNVYNYALYSDLATTNSNLNTANNNIENLSNLKADKLNPSFSGVATFNTITTQSLTDNGNIAIKGNTIIGDSSGDTLIVTGLSTFNQDVIIKGTNVPTKFSILDSSISTLDTTTVKLNGNQVVNDVKTFTTAPKINSYNIATTNDITTAINNLINSAPSTLDTLGEIASVLNANTNDISTIVSSMVTLGTTQTVSSTKTFSSSPQVPTLTQGNNSTSCASTAYVDAGLNTKANTSALSDYLTITDASSTYQTQTGMSSYLTTANASSTYQTQTGMSSYLTTSSASSTYQTQAGMSSYLTTSTASSTYQTQSAMSSYPTLSGSNTMSGVNEFSSEIVNNKLVENFSSGTVTTNAMSINYSSNTNNIYAITPSSANNIALTITNIPTTRSAIYDFTFIINTSTNKNYINTLNVNGSSVTMKGVGGLTNLSVDASSTVVIQNIYIQMTNSTVTNAITSLSSCY